MTPTPNPSNPMNPSNPTTPATADPAGTIDWTHELAEQIDWHWRNQLRPRLAGLTDEEYRWEPVAGSWNVRRRGEPAPVSPDAGGIQAGAGDWVIDFAWPEPTPVPVTTIAWRLGHVIVGVLAARTASHFGGAAADYVTWSYAAGADEALAQLDEHYEAWLAGIRGLSEADLRRPCGPAEGPYADYPMATLILHITRELIHHGAEIALLRDLYAHQALPSHPAHAC